MSKSVFDVQGCHALILALARLSCKRLFRCIKEIRFETADCSD